MARGLLAGARRLGVALGPADAARLATYCAEAARWGRRINLTGAPDAVRFAREHVLDALAALPHMGIGPGEAWADVGSGAGVPGVPLAVLTPDTRWTLIEPRQRRWAFLVHVTHLLGLANVTVLKSRADAAPLAPGTLDGIASRAVGDVALSCHAWLRPGGRVVLWAGPDRARWPEAGDGPLTAEPPVALKGPKREGYLLVFRKAG